jgi:D-alanyl-D-alanine carboxypeptidase (penicillin-binding protein 5/6)
LNKYCLIASAEKNDRELLLVLIGCKSSGDRYKEAKSIFEYMFNEKKRSHVVLNKGPLAIAHKVGREKVPVYGELKQDIVVWSYPSEQQEFTGTVHWHELSLPLKKGDIIGEVQIKDKPTGTILVRAPVYALNDVEKGLWASILDSIPFE